MKYRFWVVLFIFIVGMYLRYDNYITKHPDQDELFELHSMWDWDKGSVKSIKSIFDNKQFYGDHTSFPGEFILYYLPMKMVLHNPKIDVGNMTVSGVGRYDFLKLASVKVVLFVISFWLLYSICSRTMGGWGTMLAMAIYGFNFQLVYHAFDMRPYSVLPVLAIANLWLCSRRDGVWSRVMHGAVALFTCIYHAYGILIVLVTMVFLGKLRRNIFICLMGLCLWSFYAWYNHFGFSPNKVQAVVDTFQYFPKVKFFENLLLQLSGGSLIFYMLIPLLAFSFIRGIEYFDGLFLIWMIIIPLLAIFLVDLKTHYWFHPRQFTWVIPFFAIFCGRMVHNLENNIVKTP